MPSITTRVFVTLVSSLVFISCSSDPAESEKTALVESPSLVPSDTLKPWAEILAFAGSGEVIAEDGVLILGQGEALTGVVYTPEEGTAYPFPLVDYEITLEARRTRGSDIFCALTFPYKDLDTFASLIVGGWGGGLIGISSISELDASENETRAFGKFENDVWYKIRLTVEDDYLKAFIDDAIVINYPLNGKPLSLKPGDIDACVPLGLASFASRAEIKDVKITALKK